MPIIGLLLWKSRNQDVGVEASARREVTGLFPSEDMAMAAIFLESKASSEQTTRPGCLLQGLWIRGCRERNAVSHHWSVRVSFQERLGVKWRA